LAVQGGYNFYESASGGMLAVIISNESLKIIADPELVYIVRRDYGRPLAFVVCVPNYNEALIHMRGRLFPIEVIQLLFGRGRGRQYRRFRWYSKALS
jgi:hypothetical protein